MYSPEEQLKPPCDYNFPYEPYAIQAELMRELYLVLEEKKIGIFESPTGTGKSLTLTCGALRWLEDHQSLVRRELEQRIEQKELELKQKEAANSRADDWISAQYETNQERFELKKLRDLKAWIEEYDHGISNINERQTIRKDEIRLHTFKKQKKQELQTDVKEETLLETQLKDVLEHNSAAAEENFEERAKLYRDVQIFFCSRTHSQLAQVVREVKNTAYGKRVRCITLGSRQQLCVNPKIKNLKNKSLINERCLELTQQTEKLTKSNVEDCSKKEATKSCNCPFKTQSLVQQLAETALVDIMDIEELAKEGNEQKACAYYAARNAAVSAAQLIMLPYQTLLHHRTRKRSGINLQGAIVIIDEAHNLLDTIADLHSCELSCQQLTQAKNAIQAYKERYVKRLNSENLLNINQLLYVIRCLINVLNPKKSSFDEPCNGVCKSRIVRTYELTGDSECYNIDLFKLLEFCERTRFVQKLHGFTQEKTDTEPLKENTPPKPKENATMQLLKRLESEESQTKLCKSNKKDVPPAQKVAQTQEASGNENLESKGENTTASLAPLYAFIAFLESLTEEAEDGRVLIKVDGTPTGSSFKYIVLNPSNYFQDVVQQARAIIIAGGTMQPTNELTEQLFHKCPERVRLNFYDHVVSRDAVLPFVVQQGPTNKRLCYKFPQRSSADMLLELSMILQNLCQVVPAGLVCFFPSYDYLENVYEYLRNKNLLAQINAKKRVFREARATQNGQSVEQLLHDYDATIKQQGGALLLSVVGGKLSEGLNFKDNLARAVIVVGMPYANSQSLELQERRNFLDSTLGAGSGREYYENLCMKAVNQCIGRAVRHIHDYAAVYLLDERYANENVRKKLPQWIARSLQVPPTFGLMQATTAKYFKLKREKQ